MEINYSDHLEKMLGNFFIENNILFVHESQNKAQGLDFYLPDYYIYIEVKQFHADRVAKQLAAQDNVILLQGRKTVEFFINNFKR